MPEEGFFEHPMIEKRTILRREYQTRIASKALSSSTLVVLPTGLGKTVIALMVIAEKLNLGSDPILMMAPTKPLVEQHRDFLTSNLKDTDIGMVTGEVPPEERREEYSRFKIMVATPQVIKNDIISGSIDLAKYSMVLFDESHRATGDYPYVFIAEMYYRWRPTGSTMGLTASPGHDISKIYEVCRNLGIEDIEVRVDSDPDVKPYIQDMDIQRIKVEVSKGMRETISLLDRMFMERASRLQRMGVMSRSGIPNVKQLLAAGGRIREMINKAGKEGGSLYQAMSIQAQAMKISHAMELAETQGSEALYQYLDRLLRDTGSPDCSKATRAVVSDPLYNTILNRTSALRTEDPPKIDAMERFIKQKLREDPDARIITFTHYRDTATQVLERLSEYKGMGIRPVRFVGHSTKGSDKGLSQKKQKEVLEEFRAGSYNVLVATSVAEEGLDIPGADLVIFYEPIPSEIRTIQRRGRTGRHSAGKVVVLMSKETRDIAYSFSARDKEMKMERQLLSLRRMIKKQPIPKKEAFVQTSSKTEIAPLDSFADEEKKQEDPLEIIVDQREMPSSVVEELIRNGVAVSSSPLENGDYILSEKLIIERKTAQDLSDSLVDGRLLRQMKEVRDRFERPVLLIEGDGIFEKRKISKNALIGALVSINIDFNIPVIFTRDPKETALYMIIAARREKEKGRKVSTPSSIRGNDLRSIQLKVISGLPGISITLAERVLSHFGSLERIFNADEKELEKVEGIGKNKAKSIRGAIVGLSETEIDESK